MKRLFMALALTLLAQFALLESALAAVNINTATQDEFIALKKGLGPAKAQAIIDYRRANGPFKSVDDLRHVKGIGAKRLEKLRPELTVGPVTKVAAAGAGKAEVKSPPAVVKGDIRPVAQPVHK